MRAPGLHRVPPQPKLRHTHAVWIILAVWLAIIARQAMPQSQSERGSKVDAAQQASEVPNGGYYALIVGIDDYQKPLDKLQTPVHDAEEVAQLLRADYGFQTRTLLNQNATRNNILGALDAYRSSLSENDNLLIYFAGHGYYDHEADRAYWLPVDATSPNSPNHISADDITGAVRALPPRHVLIISDSCYSGDLTRGASSAASQHNRPALIQRMLQSRSRTLMTSGGDEPVSDSGADDHSIFAYAVLCALRDESIGMFTATELFDHQVQQHVAGSSSQTPRYTYIQNSGHNFGDFVFIRISKTNSAAVPTSQVVPTEASEMALSQPVHIHSPADHADEPVPVLPQPPELSIDRFYELAPKFTDKGKECESGNALTCETIAIELQTGLDKSPPDHGLAIAFYERACALGRARSCSQAGACFEEGNGVEKDTQVAAAFYNRACNLKDGKSCWDLARLYQDGNGVPKIITHAMVLVDRGCGFKDGDSCKSLGDFYRDGICVEQNSDRALDYYRLACEVGHGPECFSLGQLLEWGGHGISADKAQAATYYRMACDRDKKLKFACSEAKRLGR